MSRAKVTLRYIVWPADFRKNDATLYRAVPKAVRQSLKGNDAVCFVSGAGNQVMFVYRSLTVGMTKGNKLHRSRRRELFPSFKLRLNVGTFNPEMLTNYADDVGLELVGIKRFEERYTRYLEAA